MAHYRSVDSKLLAEAMTWFVRIRDRDDPEDPYTGNEERQAAFVAWLRASPRHTWAYFEAADYFKELRANAPRQSSAARPRQWKINDRISSKLPGAQGRSRKGWFDRDRTFMKLRFSLSIQRSRHPGLATLLGIFLAIRVALPVPDFQPQSCYRSYTTLLGQHQPIVLEDGSTIHLNTNTALLACITPQRRDIRLLFGEARFDVAHDATRPFRVRHGRTVIEDVGTSFDAYATERETRVAVLQGRVNVYDSPEFLAEAPQHSSSSGPNTPVSLDTVPLSLDAGMQAHIPDDLNARDKQTVSTLDPHEIARLNDWQHGEIPLDGLSLLESTREFSRYNRVRFVIADPEIGELQPAGIFTATHVDGYLGFLQDKFWIVATSAVDDQGMRVITLTRKPSSSRDPPPRH